MKQTFILLCIPLILGGCTGETSPVEDGMRVALQPGVTTATAGTACSRSIVNGIGAAADRINTVGIYVARASDHATYPGTPDAGTVFSAPATAGQPWTSQTAVYVNSVEGRLYAWSPATLAITRNASAAPTVPVSVPAAQTFDGASTTACSTTDYLYGSASGTPGSEAAISVSRTAHTPDIYLQHALAQVVFTMDNAADRPADAEYDYVKSITLKAGSGTPFKATAASSRMSLADGSLTDITTAGELSFTPSSNPARPGSTGSPNVVAYGLVIPKAATAGNSITVTVVMGKTGDTADEREYTVQAGTLFDAAWTKGSRYTYHLILGNRNITLGTVDIGGWQDGGTTSGGEMPPEGTPLQVLAGIGNTPATRAGSDETTYDRKAFKAADKIRITRSKNGNTATSDYQLNADGNSWSVTAGTEFTFESAATYSAVYPLDYNGIRADQRTTENFRLSNRLATPSGIKADRTGVLAFTGTNQFTHVNGRITLALTGTHDITFAADKTVLTLKGTGIYSGGTQEETIYPLRPDAAGNTWCAVFSPLQAGSRTIALTLEVSDTDNGNPFTITYSCNLTCACLKDTHYRYNLSVVNDRLVPEGVEIEEWHNADNGYVGDFNGNN